MVKWTKKHLNCLPLPKEGFSIFEFCRQTIVYCLFNIKKKIKKTFHCLNFKYSMWGFFETSNKYNLQSVKSLWEPNPSKLNKQQNAFIFKMLNISLGFWGSFETNIKQIMKINFVYPFKSFSKEFNFRMKL